MCEPYVSPLSFPVYRFLHEERCDLAVDPLAEAVASGGDPFDGNQAIPTHPVRRAAGPSSPAASRSLPPDPGSNAWPARPTRRRAASRGRPLPGPFFRALLAMEDRLPRGRLPDCIGFRLLAVLRAAR